MIKAVNALFNDNNIELAVEVSDTVLELCRVLINERPGVLCTLRNISISSGIFLERFLPTSGALEILFQLGYQEGEDCFHLPVEVEARQAAFLLWQALVPARDRAVQVLLSQHTLPPAFTFNGLPHPAHSSEARLLSDMVSVVQRVQPHEDTALQQRALNVLPLQELLARAQRKENQLQNLPSISGCTRRDLLLLELLSWFKECFFQWMDIPACPWCGGITVSSSGESSSVPQELDLHWGASRIEVYSCQACSANVRFPRYNSPERLLFTRRGRCGEWANCFLLFLRALKFEARLVSDSQDHVWTEAYSEGQSRWLHCDPCENKCDTPLLYQNGWRKELLYVWAYAHDHVQDVTWRYTTQHRLVVQRRKEYRESFLLSLLASLCARLQPPSLSPEHKDQLLRRKLSELVEFLAPPSTSSTSPCEGRTSGSLSWRLARGETTGDSEASAAATGFVFTPTEKEKAVGQMTVSYSSITDRYYRPLSEKADLKGWSSGAWKSSGIFRKEERDWKKVYLCPREGSTRGSLSWRFRLPSGVTSVSLVCSSTTFQKGNIRWTLSGGERVHCIQNGELKDETLFYGIHELTLTAELFCEDFWQHAQLFRMDTSGSPDTHWPLHINISFHSPTQAAISRASEL